MRIEEPIESAGMFWHPATPHSQIPGVLKISGRGEITLDVFGINSPPYDDLPNSLSPAPQPFSTATRVDRILGVIRKHAVSLEHCHYGAYRYNYAGTISESTIHARRAYVGVLYENSDNVHFNSVTFWLEGLHEWLKLSGYSVDEPSRSDNLRFTLTSAAVEPITIILDDEKSLRFDLSRTLPSVGPTATSITITQLAHVTIRTQEPKPLDYFLRALFPMEMLLSLAMDQPSAITRVLALTPELVDTHESGREHRLPIEVYGQLSPRPSPSREVSYHEMLFTHDDIKDRFAETLRNWFSYCATVDPAIRLYFAIASGAYRSAEGQFLSSAQAIEALHRRTFQREPHMPDSEFAQMLKKIGRVIPSEHRERTLAPLQHANEQSFRHRLKDMFNDFADSFGKAKDRDGLVQDIVDARNYLTHYDAATVDLSPGGRSLIRMQNKLEALFQMHMLQALGFKPSEIDEIARRRLDHKLNVSFL